MLELRHLFPLQAQIAIRALADDLLLHARLLCTLLAPLEDGVRLAEQLLILGRPVALRALDERRMSVVAKDEAHAVVLAPVEVRGLREGCIAAQEDVRPSGPTTERDRSREQLGRSLLGGSIATAVDDEQRLARIRERHDEWVIAPRTGLRDVYAMAMPCLVPENLVVLPAAPRPPMGLARRWMVERPTTERVRSFAPERLRPKESRSRPGVLCGFDGSSTFCPR